MGINVKKKPGYAISEGINSRIRSNTPTGLLGINIGPNKDTKDRLNDYLIGLRTFHDISDYITINISSPNTENLRDFHDQIKLEDLITLYCETEFDNRSS